MREGLATNHQQLLRPGEKYELHWPGGGIGLWDWESIRDHGRNELKSKQARDPKLPPLILHASSSVLAFTGIQESEPWPDRPDTRNQLEYSTANSNEADWRQHESLHKNPPPSPSPRKASERVAGAPILSMEIECLTEWGSNTVIKLSTNVTYEGVGDECSGARPITFHTWPFKTDRALREGLRLYKQRRDGKWDEVIDDDDNPGFAIYDDPDNSVNVGDENGKYSDQFATLWPGETWNTSWQVQDSPSSTSLPDDVQVGDTFKYVNVGAIVDWWDWGTKEDHTDTVVELPCYIASDVKKPADNDGRPKLVVPASNEVVFSYVG